MKLTILFVQFARACGCVNFTVFCILLGCNLDHHISQAAWAAQTVWKHQEILQFTAAIRSWSDIVRPSTVLWRKYVQQHWCSRYICFLFSYIMLYIYIHTVWYTLYVRTGICVMGGTPCIIDEARMAWCCRWRSTLTSLLRCRKPCRMAPRLGYSTGSSPGCRWKLLLITHRIHVCMVYMLTFGVYWW